MIEARAPVRVCDLGGWTDTWFGGPGRILNIAVDPGVRVRIAEVDDPAPTRPPVTFRLEAYDLTYAVWPGVARTAAHPLLEAAVDTYPPPRGAVVDIAISSPVPPGSGTGTSASVSVALIGALAHLRGESIPPSEVAHRAFDLETNHLGMESGIQDQLCAAHGGVSYIEMATFPKAVTTRLPYWEELNDVLTLVTLGRAHDSPAIHRTIIESAAESGAPVFERLRQAALAGREAVLAQDLAAFGTALVANTEAQRDLHPPLLGLDASAVIDLAAQHAALGWKVNGAGGDGGSVTILSRDQPAKARLEVALRTSFSRYDVLPIRLNEAGLQIETA